MMTMLVATFGLLPAAFDSPSRQLKDGFTPTNYCERSHCATVPGSNLTQVPMRNDGIRPALACLKIVILDSAKMCASSSAVKA
jgi:hypothetical protein